MEIERNNALRTHYTPRSSPPSQTYLHRGTFIAQLNQGVTKHVNYELQATKLISLMETSGWATLGVKLQTEPLPLHMKRLQFVGFVQTHTESKRKLAHVFWLQISTAQFTLIEASCYLSTVTAFKLPNA